MHTVYGALALAEIAIGALVVLRLALGPTVADRIVALNTVCTQAALSVFFYAAYTDRSIYLDVAIWFASFSYLGAIVFARYLERELL
ncbi:multiple resistance and pH regulation protein F [Catenulispora acidiphila DSM 44928]|uniref:Multiple resistance and pH regulation protein F n=1 Tax=Catenulispora acidiphila (strain DSM 44928 / JCM 14897 / NBRC 102108 / NRRL B-24433 / ID139908) TaxID=479433 RepID=C7Q1H1_CATAD|nr:monovalent cation/H+ antiporter complex subunit F [Catenulispora acidiphila]ACU73700.1 multiple resistance and pH regulation protein F [Catenulispora acidiphila DSM 44928]